MKPAQEKSGGASLAAFSEKKMTSLGRANWVRNLQVHARYPGMRAERDPAGAVISFSDNDYLGLAHHPEVIEAAAAATLEHGAGAGASRLVTGNHPLYTDLESTLARIKGTEDAVVFGSGYLASTGIIPVFAGKQDVIFADELVHSSIRTGMELSGASVFLFRHNDTGHLAGLLERHRGDGRNALILVDGGYSMDGDLAPLREIGEMAAQYDAWLFSDDAHGLGTVGGGKGSTTATGADGLVPLQMGTLSKAVGTYGGYLAADRIVCDLARNRCRSLVYTTALPPGTIAAATRALEIIEGSPELCARPLELAGRFAAAMHLPAPESPIVPLITGSEQTALDCSRQLLDAGFLVSAIRPPTVPRGTSRLRFCFSATPTDADIDHLVQACKTLKLDQLS